ncbi:uncharacterized protein [Musca autumnalis]|uniref:uncharacterized protein n=1 Tax=Musca autumnalis TaxID=221902 RepID=UPI003CFAE756
MSSHATRQGEFFPLLGYLQRPHYLVIMVSYNKAVIVLLIISYSGYGFSSLKFLLEEISTDNIYQEMLQEIAKEKPVETLLIFHQNSTKDKILETFFQAPIPKAVITKSEDIHFLQKINTQLLSIFLMSDRFDGKLLEIGANILDNRRQTRILVVAINVKAAEEFKTELLKQCEDYKMTNVLLHFLQEDQESVSGLYAIKPYPEYHWQNKNEQEKYYPPHWQNMHNKTLVTLIGQDPLTGLAYLDKNGKMQMNGYTARLVMLFAEHFNASLKMHKSFKFGKITSYLEMNELSRRGELDIPMSLSTTNETSVLKTDYYEIIGVALMVPCPTQLNYRELFTLLLNEYFFAWIILSSVLLSIIHCIIDYYFDKLWNWTNFIVNDKILPGVLGQSFATSHSPWRSLKIVYLLVSFIGLNIAVEFSANINTLFTQPPYHKSIQTAQDLHGSRVKILIDPAYSNLYVKGIGFGNQITEVSPDSATYLRHKGSFDSTYAYVATTTEWEALFEKRQQFFAHKQFCITSKLPYLDAVLYQMVLVKNSPYLEPMNELILRVHDGGFVKAWHSSTFMDMVKLKNISLMTGYTIVDNKKILTVDDLFWTWMIVVVGSAISVVSFLGELWWWRRSNNNQ